tara:strand:- start:4877 stop:4996 length:120 start_codon:yes stop_codon:yes gene_type:complete
MIKITLKLRGLFGNNRLFSYALNELSAVREAEWETTNYK